MKKTKYAVYWVSPCGFANEGNYIYGTLIDCRKVAGRYNDDVSARTWLKSTHRSAEKARAVSEKLAREDRRATPAHEICNVSAAPAVEFLQ